MSAALLASSVESLSNTASVKQTPNAIFEGVPRTIYDDADPKTYLGQLGEEKVMINSQGLKLRSYFWPAPGQPKAAILFIHGHGAHIFFEILRLENKGEVPAYSNSWVERWNASGISVCGLDLQGCGRSEGARGLRIFVEQFEDYISDNIQLARSLKDQPGFAGVPLFVSGISMGGNIALNCALQGYLEGLFKGAALLAPMLSLEKVARKGLNPYLRPLSTLLSYVLPTAAIVATDRNTLYPAIQAMWDADPLVYHGKTRVRNANEYLRITEQVMSTLENVSFPFIVFHSENDTMCDCDGSKELFKRASTKDKTLRLVNKMWHVLVREEGNEIVHKDITDWVLHRV